MYKLNVGLNFNPIFSPNSSTPHLSVYDSYSDLYVEKSKRLFKILTFI